MNEDESGTFPIERPTTNKDELDELFNYDAGLNDPFSNNYQPVSTQKEREDSRNTSSIHRNEDLGIDDEIDLIRKQRAPRVKLDEELLLSSEGIPKLQSKAKRFQVKGKGQEFSDTFKLLSMYQLWLDDLFPKARFLDAVAMVEKLGHKKKVLAMRMDWIDDHKSSLSFDQEEAIPNTSSSNLKTDFKHAEDNLHSHDKIRDDSLVNQHTNIMDDNGGLFEDAEKLVASSHTEPLDQSISATRQTTSQKIDSTIHDVPEDELDALFAEEIDPLSDKKDAKLCFDDDEDAMAEMEMDW
ncbi:Chromosome segregation in meiosis protein 3 [Golovinomyces cichoracearum]|uniref:Chromosome segregation in meiosis protein n=1 Tax=Golovinomyces cichoracearum TaxID=62708 RepID=A0A420HHI7_9PEZI|nr:Chromosome segregation in meiosis protein 3 [Golovinomyces cichoracearum]